MLGLTPSTPKEVAIINCLFLLPSTPVDPSAAEEYLLSVPSSLHGLLVVGLMPSLNQIAGFHQTGSTTIDVFQAGLKTCVQAAQKALPLVRKKIAESEGMLGTA